MTEKTIPYDDPSLESEVTAPELHEQTLEQVLLTPISINKDDRCSVRLHDVIGYNITKDIIGYIASQEDISFTSTLSTALVHGWSIMSHEHADVFKHIFNCRNESLLQGFKMYHRVSSGLAISPQFCNNTFYGHVDDNMHADFITKADLLRMPIGKYATMCLCMSLQDCNYVIPEHQIKFKETVQYFNYTCNVMLKFLDELKY